ncbi:MAG: hypothetical protein ACLVJ6_10655 [Merdibacter sp.]
MIVGKGIWTIMKKELARFFKDGRMCLTTLLLPGLMIYLIVLWDALGSQLNVTEDFQPAIRAVEISDSMRELFAQAGMETEEIGADEQADAMNAVQQEEIDLLIVFPQDFDAAVRAYDVSAGEAAPNIEIYYNPPAQIPLPHLSRCRECWINMNLPCPTALTSTAGRKAMTWPMTAI